MSEVRPFYHQEHALLQGLVTAKSLPASLRDRSRMILLSAHGVPRWEIAARLGYATDTVRTLTGRKPRSFAEFAHEHAGLFQA